MNETLLQSFGVGVAIFYLLIIGLLFASLWKIFVKAGRPGWEGIVPIYNIIILHKIVGKPAWWIVLYLIPFVNLIINIWVTNLLAKSFGQSEGFTIGLVFLPFVFYPVLAFGSAQYQGPAAGSATGNIATA